MLLDVDLAQQSTFVLNALMNFGQELRMENVSARFQKRRSQTQKGYAGSVWCMDVLHARLIMNMHAFDVRISQQF